ncbi:MAG: SDR family oxidoreductase [Myxococcales bacterium]|nr:SDR family oxidoreductase [Myxococcales bacterium]
MTETKRRALVTGGSRGIGLAIARALARDGLDVIVSYGHDAAGAEAQVAQARSEGLMLSAVRCDAARAEDWDALFARGGPLGLAEQGVQVLIHAAGFAKDGLLMTQAPTDFDAVQGVHLRGAYLASRACLRAMIGERFGRIVYISSPTATLGRRGQCSYGAAKAGLLGLARSLMMEVSRFQITVNCVSAGLIDTALTAELPKEVYQSLLSSVPMARAGKAEEVAELVRYLVSPAGGYVTGQLLAVDGGLDMLAADAF